MGALDNAFAVLEGVSRFQPIGVTELARKLEMSKATAQRALVDLERHGWIRRAPENEQRWIITTKALTIGSRHRGSSDVRQLARPAMEELAGRTGETIHLTILDGIEVVLIERIEAESALRTHARIGDRGYLHYNASGLAMMAAMRDDDVLDLLAATAERITPPTPPLDKARVLGNITEVRECGYSVVNGMRHPDVSAIAAAVLDAKGSPFAAISVSMPTQRLAPELVNPFAAAVVEAARRCNIAG